MARAKKGFFEENTEAVAENAANAKDAKKTAEADAPETADRPSEKEAEKRLFTEEEMKALVAKAVADAMAGTEKPAAKTVAQDEMVTVLYLDEVSPNSALELPGYGSIRAQSYIDIPKKEFGNKFMGIAIVRKLIERRKLIVMDGLTQEERERWNCDYKDGELLDERTFDKMLDYPTEKLAEIFERLCPEHQKFVAVRMITAKERNDNRISVEKAKRINDLSKKNDPNGMLRPVMQAFGAEIVA